MNAYRILVDGEAKENRLSREEKINDEENDKNLITKRSRRRRKLRRKYGMKNKQNQ
jgi:hypothetical protein